MYVKPEVTRYSGKELLDLMGPVETAYDCNLDGPEFLSCPDAEETFRLVSPEGTTLDDWGSERWLLTGPGTCGDTGWTSEGGDLGEWDGASSPDGFTRTIDFRGNLHSILGCDDSGDWMLEVYFVQDGTGDRSETCDIVIQSDGC